MSNKKVLLLALICGLLTAVTLNFYLKSVKDAITNVKSKKVAVATVRIPARSLVTAEKVAFKDIPMEYVHGSSVTDPSQVIGYTTRAEIEAGEPILQTKLVPKESSGSTLAYTVPLGMRAISIDVNEQTGVSGMLTPGDRVDVLGTVDIEIFSPDPTVNTVKETKTHVVLQNIEVLAVGKNYTAPGVTEGEGEGKAQEGGSTVTIAVPPEKMQLVAHMASRGKLYLALRAPADKSEEDRPPIDSLQLLR
ncbi:MAG: Flp pilus assembly protein CpaB [Firmicutes bacterium HGW-Firmicutes-14]|nr:MAG: Flp pilus assembly protein CpaB [Firmicutes bacterium HGW-Firmicutes-14]